MTDRIRYLTVVLDDDYRDDGAKMIADAIAMTKGVAKVELGEPVGANDYLNREVVRMQLVGDLIDLARKK